MKHYTVLLLRPDYVDDSGTDTHLTQIEALGPTEAVLLAQHEAYSVDHEEPDVRGQGSADDYYLLALFEGHLKDLSWATGMR